jgi:hypothetical protein
MSDEYVMYGEKNQDNLIQIKPISLSDITEAIFKTVDTTREFKTEKEKNSELENESKYSAELNEILTQLHEADDYISETRQNTSRLGVETRSMLDDLRKQLS